MGKGNKEISPPKTRLRNLFDRFLLECVVCPIQSTMMMIVMTMWGLPVYPRCQVLGLTFVDLTDILFLGVHLTHP